MSSLKEEKKPSKEELSPPDYQKSDLEKSDDEVGLEMSARLDAVGVDGVYERKVSFTESRKLQREDKATQRKHQKSRDCWMNVLLC